MDEKEMKKIDEKGEEKVSGGLNFDKEKVKDILLVQEYGCPALEPILNNRLKQFDFKKCEKVKKPEEALTPSQPKTEEKK